MGLAMLTKFSFLLAAPLYPAALGLRLIACKNYAPRDWLKSLGLIVLVCLAVCGWHYGHVWASLANRLSGTGKQTPHAPGVRTPVSKRAPTTLALGILDLTTIQRNPQLCRGFIPLYGEMV